MKNMLLTRAAELNATNLIDNLTGAQADMVGFTAQMRNAASSATQTAAKADRNRTSVSEVVAHLAGIDEREHQVADAITVLNARSQEINAAVSLITEISDQTNLLALNAAIEAARAGESGRWFAVVADEVRKLAGKTRAASQSIGEIMRGLTRDGTVMQTNAQQMQEMTASSATVVNSLRAGRFSGGFRPIRRSIRCMRKCITGRTACSSRSSSTGKKRYGCPTGYCRRARGNGSRQHGRYATPR